MKYLLLTILFVISCKKEKSEHLLEMKEPIIPERKEQASKRNDFDVLKLLVDNEAQEDPNHKIDYKNYWISFPNDGDAYEVYFDKIASEDFNSDGITDYIIRRTSEGMLGGNANTNSQILYIIMGQNNAISQKHCILAYAPFSYNILDNVIYKNGKLEAKATKNYRTYSGITEDSLQSANLSFIYRDNNIYEESYLKRCELAKWKNKKVLINASKREKTIDMHNYTEVINEKYTDKDKEISVELSGCDNLNLVFEGNFKTNDFSEESIREKKQNFIGFLADNSNLKELNTIVSYYRNNSPSENYTTLDTLTFNLFTNKEKGKINFRLVISKDTNPSQNENWEITTRIK